jgi:hypothetical protein
MDAPLPQQPKGGSNHHANAEMIDKTGVLFLGEVRASENLADSGRTFHADGRSDADVIVVDGGRFANPPYRAEITLMILELVFFVDLAVAAEPA